MKRLLSMLLVAVLAVTCILAVLPVGAATASVTAKATKGDITFTDLDKIVDGKDDGASLKKSGSGEATAEIIVDLGEAKVIGSVSVSIGGAPLSVAAAVSADGKDFYDVNAGGTVTALTDGVAAIDFSTRIAAKVKYVKAIITFDAAELTVKEIIVGDGNDSVEAFAPNAAFAYAEGTTPNPGAGIYTEAKDYDLSNKDDGVFFQSAQITIAAWDDAVKAYKVRFNKVNPWPEGHNETVTLKEGEILIAIQTQGAINTGSEVDTTYAAAKWIMRGLKDGDYIVLDKDNTTFTMYPSTHTFASDETPGTSTPETSAPDASSEAPAESSKTEAASTPAATSSTAPAASSTSKPSTGDEGIVLFAVLGLVAVAGTAIAVKARH